MRAEGKTYDPPFYTEEELDELYERDPVAALKISREQHQLRKLIEIDLKNVVEKLVRNRFPQIAEVRNVF